MGLEDLAMFRTVPGCVVFYPSDVVSAERALELAANYRGMTYTRTTRAETEVMYGPDEVFEIGKGKIVRQSVGDKLTVVAAGITLHETLKAADILAGEGM
ncbi:Transketolase-like protein 1 [Oopsacas minuta]|uniref:Transketolase-like protein 1 n=1 Tax=Oopsacas minuta TaxID=111878 RepID=A0AAV7K946_9METZ|nr:Transketolase-like protein 1 [Oopsacas minuta]